MREIDRTLWPLFEANHVRVSDGNLKVNREKVIGLVGCSLNEYRKSLCRWKDAEGIETIPYRAGPVRAFPPPAAALPLPAEPARIDPGCTETLEADFAPPPPETFIPAQTSPPTRHDKRPYRVIAVFDLHAPGLNSIIPKPFIPVMKYAAAHPPDEWVFGGDDLDYTSVCHHEEHKLLLREGRRLKKEYEYGNHILDSCQAIQKKITKLDGNHDIWVRRAIEEHPQFAGLMEPEVQLRFRDRGITVYALHTPYKIGLLSFVHGYKRRMYESKQMALEYGNVMFGHTHRVQTIGVTTHGGPIFGFNVGCLCEDRLYWGNRPSDTNTAFTEVFFNDDGTFHVYTAFIINGRFIGPDGRLYHA